MVYQHEIEEKEFLNGVPLLTFSNFVSIVSKLTPIISLAIWYMTTLLLQGFAGGKIYL